MKSSIKKIAVSEIQVGDRIRLMDQAWMQAIAVSIQERGQLHPISVLQIGDQIWLSAGLHRLGAFRFLKREKIEARVFVGDDTTDLNELRLLEISENLIRKDLTALERALNFCELKRIHEERHPETGHGKRRKQQANDNKGENKVAIIATLSKRFTSEVAETCGLSERSIQLAIKLGEGICPDVRVKLFPTWLANHQAQLIKLSEQDPETQSKIYDLIFGDDPKAKTVADALDLLTGKPAEKQTDKFYTRTVDNWARLNGKQRTAFFKLHETDVLQYAKARGWIE